MKEIKEILSKIDSLEILEQYRDLAKIGNDFLQKYSYSREEEIKDLAIEITQKVHSLRFRLSHNKATDQSSMDQELKELSEELIQTFVKD